MWLFFPKIDLLAQVSTFPMVQPPVFWFLLGTLLCASDIFLMPKTIPFNCKYIVLMMGVSAWVTSFVLWQFARILGFNWRFAMYEDVGVQIVYWMGVSMAFIIWIRPMFHRRKSGQIEPEIEALTLTEILPGKVGRVLYEGTSWQARLEKYSSAIQPNEKVYVLRCEGNTLVVVSDALFHA